MLALISAKNFFTLQGINLSDQDVLEIVIHVLLQRADVLYVKHKDQVLMFQ